MSRARHARTNGRDQAGRPLPRINDPSAGKGCSAIGPTRPAPWAKGPPGRVVFPRAGLSPDGPVRMKIGPIAISDRPPLWRFAEQALAASKDPVRVLEIGPGAGVLAAHLQTKFSDKIDRYVALERDETFTGPYERVEEFDAVPASINVIIAGEVAEHMSADDWYERILLPLRTRASRDARLVMSVPNPASPVGLGRDFTHVQRYPWYDLYALLRLEFEHVEIHRSYYAWSFQRIAFLLPRMVLCPLLEFDWCDTLVCVASNPATA